MRQPGDSLAMGIIFLVLYPIDMRNSIALVQSEHLGSPESSSQTGESPLLW